MRRVEEKGLRNIFSKIKLKWRIFGFLLGFCVLLLIILWFLQISFLDEFYRRIRIAETRSDAAFIIEHLYEDDIQEIVTQLSEAGDFRADIVDLAGRSLLLHTRLQQSQVSENVKLISAAKRNGGESKTLTNGRSTSTPSDGISPAYDLRVAIYPSPLLLASTTL